MNCGSTRRDGSRTLSSSSDLDRVLPIADRSGPSDTPLSPTLWHSAHFSSFVKNTASPRVGSPFMPRINPGRGLEPSLRPFGSGGR